MHPLHESSAILNKNRLEGPGVLQNTTNYLKAIVIKKRGSFILMAFQQFLALCNGFSKKYICNI